MAKPITRFPPKHGGGRTAALVERANPVQSNPGRVGGISVRGKGDTWGPATEKLHCHPQFAGLATLKNLHNWSLRASWSSGGSRRK